MRKELGKLNGSRLKFMAEFGKYGTKTNYKGYQEQTILFVNIKFEDGKTATDHIWFTMGKRLGSVGELIEGDKLTFEARINTYRKGYRKDQYDYKLSNPTKVTKI